MKFRNTKFNILCKRALYFVTKCEPFRVKNSMMLFWNNKKWLNKNICFKRIYASIYKSKFICDHSYISIIYKSVSYKWNITFLLNYWVICKINSRGHENYSGIYDLSDLFFFILSDCTFDTTSCILRYISLDVLLKQQHFSYSNFFN